MTNYFAMNLLDLTSSDGSRPFDFGGTFNQEELSRRLVRTERNMPHALDYRRKTSHRFHPVLLLIASVMYVG